MKAGLRFSAAAAAILAIVFVGGCSTPVKETVVTYSYDPRASFSEVQTYRWGEARPVYRQDTLLEANVRFVADRELEAKRLTLKTDKPDLVIWVGYEVDYNIYSHGNELRALTLNISRSDKNELLWRGMATGGIRTDAASGDLKKAVEGMLGNFPPK